MDILSTCQVRTILTHLNTDIDSDLFGEAGGVQQIYNLLKHGL